ncbi:MAG: exonuclease domain-containing protein [Candidatus Omnitrophota bacterium]
MDIVNPLAVLDLETTGTWVEKDRIIEIAIIKLMPSGERSVFHSRVNPLMPIPAVVSQLTGIKDQDVKDAPVFQTIAKDVAAFLEGADIGGFNVEKFDLPLLERELREAGVIYVTAGLKIFDAQKVFHVNEKRDLTAAYALYCGKPLVGAHGALADTQATLEVIEAQVARYGAGSTSVEALSVFQHREQPEFFDADRRFRWWNGELYMMFGKYAKKESLRDIAKKDAGYLTWMLGKDFSEDVKLLVSNALKGQFPQQEGAV